MDKPPKARPNTQVAEVGQRRQAMGSFLQQYEQELRQTKQYQFKRTQLDEIDSLHRKNKRFNNFTIKHQNERHRLNAQNSLPLQVTSKAMRKNLNTQSKERSEEIRLPSSIPGPSDGGFTTIESGGGKEKRSWLPNSDLYQPPAKMTLSASIGNEGRIFGIQKPKTTLKRGARLKIGGLIEKQKVLRRNIQYPE